MGAPLSIEKLGFRCWVVWANTHTGVLFKNLKSALQARRLVKYVLEKEKTNSK